MRFHPLIFIFCLGWNLAACASSQTCPDDAPPGVRQPNAHTLVGSRSWLDGWPAKTADGSLNVVVEIPAGTLDKWEVSKPDGAMRWEIKDGKPRVVQYVGYPGNYGMVPRTLLDAASGGDGDPLDVLVLGPPRTRGSVIQARAIGVLRLLDGGEKDDKILAVDTAGPFAAVTSLADLKSRFAGVTTIVETFFASYKGPGKMKPSGWGTAADAEALIKQASAAYRKKLSKAVPSP